MELTKKQEDGLKIAIERYKNGEKYTVISGYAGSGKAQPVSTIIPTPKGDKRLEDIKIGDYVYDRFGKPTKVLGVYPQGCIDNYKVTLEDGRETYCNDSHIWTYYTSKNNLCSKTLKEMMESGLKRPGKGGFKYKIPVCYPIEYEEKKFEIDPYVIGAFLGDGCCKKRQLTISSENDEIPNIIAKLLNKKCEPKRNSEKNYNWAFKLKEYETVHYDNLNRDYTRKYIQTKSYFNNFLDELCCGAKEKKIPECYFYGSVEQRINLIQGLLDTDGSIIDDGKRFNIRYTSININLIRGLQKLFTSLGYKMPTISVDKRRYKNEEKICYNLNINIPNEDKYKFFRMQRKKDIANKAKNVIKRKDYGKIAIVKIEKMKNKENMVCLYVDNSEHLYLTNDYIVTHNTTLVRFIVEALPDKIKHKICYATLTGKAAKVLQKKGNKPIKTLHKLLYYSHMNPDGTYMRRPVSTIDYKIIIVDEVSMVPKSIIDLLLSYDIYVIFLGDPGQLPAIDKNEDNGLLAKPHIFLDEIMRQAMDSEIIRLTMNIREGKKILPMRGKEVIVVNKNELNTGMLTWADQVLCATNRTKNNINIQMRKLSGFDSLEPQDGDKIICCKNDWDTMSMDENNEPLTNGTIGFIKNPFQTFEKLPSFVGGGKISILQCDFITDEGSIFKDLNIDYEMIKTGEQSLNSQIIYKLSHSKKYFHLIPKEFNYGYAMTVHKAQGSEWNKVLVIEENFPFQKEEHSRWLYTACTRAEDKLVVVSK